MVPDPVFFCTIEPPSAASQRQFDEALKFLAKEDPSLRVSFDKESGTLKPFTSLIIYLIYFIQLITGQTILAGMGELHLEVIKERIRSEYKLDVDIGRLMIAYKVRAPLRGLKQGFISDFSIIGNTYNSCRGNVLL